MRHLGTLEGTGRLSADGQDFGEVGYSLRVSEQRGIKQAAGTLTGLETLELATETHREFTLHLEGTIAGWIEHWTWVDEDPAERGRPVEWRERYDRCIWQSR